MEKSKISRQLAWNRRNRDKMKIYHHRFNISEKGRQRNLKCKDITFLQIQEWRLNNPEKQRIYTQNRRARLRKCKGSHTSKDIQELLITQHNKCGTCNKDLDKYHIDHIVPIVLGGENDKSNLQILCLFCNLSKGKKLMSEFMATERTNYGG